MSLEKMSSTQEGSSAGGSSIKKKERNRRSWTPREETALIIIMKDLIANGWKSDNSFRPGYLQRCELALRKELTNTDLKANPHIHSRVTSWKKTYGILNSILSRSGVGFNLRGTFMIECEDDQWDQIVEVNEDARLMRYKQWPYYEDWKELFGEDRATGEMAEDVADAAADMERNDTDTPPLHTEFSFENELNDMMYDQMSQSARDGQGSKSASKKRKVSEELQGVCQLLAEMNQSTNERLSHLANRIGYEFDAGKARQETFDQLGEIVGLSLENRFIVCEIITFKAERLDIWRGMQPDARPQYVEHLLRTRGAKEWC